MVETLYPQNLRTITALIKGERENDERKYFVEEMPTITSIKDKK